jgi:hypothetical protein
MLVPPGEPLYREKKEERHFELGNAGVPLLDRCPSLVRFLPPTKKAAVKQCGGLTV